LFNCCIDAGGQGNLILSIKTLFRKTVSAQGHQRASDDDSHISKELKFKKQLGKLENVLEDQWQIIDREQSRRGKGITGIKEESKYVG